MENKAKVSKEDWYPQGVLIVYCLCQGIIFNYNMDILPSAVVEVSAILPFFIKLKLQNMSGAPVTPGACTIKLFTAVIYGFS